MRTELWHVSQLLAVLAQAGDTEYVRKAGKRVAEATKKSYIPEKDRLLMAWMSQEEKDLFLTY